MLLFVVNCCCCCSHINSHNQVRGHRTDSSHSGAEEYPREKHTQPKVVHAYITADAMPPPPPETYKSEIGSQSTMCQVQAGAYVSLLTPGETKYSDCHPTLTLKWTRLTIRRKKKKIFSFLAFFVLFRFLLSSFLSFIFVSFLCWFSPIDLRLSCVCVVINTTCNIMKNENTLQL